jgi:superfamily I DNA and/or RNA helicase
VEQIQQHLNKLLQCIELEEKEQEYRFRLDEQHSLKSLKNEGLAIHPIRITRKTFGYAEYPEISFRIPYPVETNSFKDGMAIECFSQNEESIKGIVLNIDGKQGEFRLFAPDFPDWIEDDGVGIKLTPDTRTTSMMKKALNDISFNKHTEALFKTIHCSVQHFDHIDSTDKVSLTYLNDNLNESQKHAVKGMVSNDQFMIIHGPPGTGKTTTLIEGILQLAAKGEKILVSAPSNTAVDNIAKGLIDKKVKFLRIGNNSKIDAQIFPYTPEGKLIESKQDKEIKKLRIRADEMRKMANQYKRRFGKDEREQRNLLIKEVKSLRSQIKDIQRYNEEKLFLEAQVILGTPIGLMDDQAKKMDFDTLIIDEAGQCLEPLAWCIFPMANKIVLAGDHLQLPPTVLSEKAIQLGFNRSILENCFGKFSNVFFLDTQYRMREPIAQFSNEYFYEGKLKTGKELSSIAQHIVFFDTAGTGYEEEHGPDGISVQNKGELEIATKIIESEHLDIQKTAFISPYSGQVNYAKEILPSSMRISTIDSFQGQEEETIIISLVRSNSEGQIGFLKDHRRMNVALTRAKENLFIIGDSTTLAKDPYFDAMFTYLDKIGGYKTAWEIMY